MAESDPDLAIRTKRINNEISDDIVELQFVLELDDPDSNPPAVHEQKLIKEVKIQNRKLIKVEETKDLHDVTKFASNMPMPISHDNDAASASIQLDDSNDSSAEIEELNE